MSNWSEIQVKSNSVFVKIESGSPQQLRIIGDPVENMIHGFGKEAFACGGADCSKCAEGSEVKQKFKVNVYNWTLGKVQLWDFGAAIAKQLKEIDKNLASEGKTFDDMDIKVSVSGSGMQKKYMVMPWPSSKVLPPIVLHDLHKKNEVPF